MPELSIVMMTSLNGNIFCVTGHLCGEIAGHRCIPFTRASDAELWCLLCLNKRLSKQSGGWWFEMASRALWRHCQCSSKNCRKDLRITPFSSGWLLQNQSPCSIITRAWWRNDVEILLASFALCEEIHRSYKTSPHWGQMILWYVDNICVATVEGLLFVCLVQHMFHFHPSESDAGWNSTQHQTWWSTVSGDFMACQVTTLSLFKTDLIRYADKVC